MGLSTPSAKDTKTMQHDHGPEHTTDRQPSAPRKSEPPSGAGLAALQRTAGNAAVVRFLQRAGHPYAEPPAPESEQHRHGAGCGHPQTAEQPRPPSVQRSAVHDVLKGAGRPLDTPVREDMEARLGADFSDVRVHDDSAARTSATEVGARAYTSGNHIVIGDGGGDKHTLAHELTHVIQQRQGPVAGTDNGSGLAVSDPSDRFERAAEANATRVMRSAAPLRDDTADPAAARRRLRPGRSPCSGWTGNRRGCPGSRVSARSTSPDLAPRAVSWPTSRCTGNTRKRSAWPTSWWARYS